MITQIIELSGKPHEVGLTQQSKNDWTATGEHMGERLAGRGPSAASAVANWRMAARFQEEFVLKPNKAEFWNGREAAE